MSADKVEALAAVLDVLMHTTSFATKKVRDGHAKAVADLTAAHHSQQETEDAADLRLDISQALSSALGVAAVGARVTDKVLAEFFLRFDAVRTLAKHPR